MLFLLSTKDCNYGICVGQLSSYLTKFIVNNIVFMSLNKFTIKIYYITHVMVLILYQKYFYLFI